LLMCSTTVIGFKNVLRRANVLKWPDSCTQKVIESDDPGAVVVAGAVRLDSGSSHGRAGQVVLQLKSPYKDGTSHVVMEPLEFMERLAAAV
jgi:hypothetical protein